MVTNEHSTRASLTSYVLRTIARGHPRLERMPGSGYGSEHQRLGSTQQSALVNLELLGGEIARLVYQRGRLVYASLGDASLETALRVLRTSITSSLYTLIELTPPQLALCLAAIDGQISGQPTERPPLAAVLSDAAATRFSGVLSLELGVALAIWQWRDGALVASPAVQSDSPRAKMLRIAWSERDLPALPSDLPALPSELLGGANTPTDTPHRLNPTKSGPREPSTAAPRPTPPAAAGLVALEAPDSSERLWQVFEQVLRGDIGLRSERLVLLLRSRFAGQSPSELQRSLTEQLERVSGSDVAASFERSLSSI